jgi:hypothetical protein
MELRRLSFEPHRLAGLRNLPERLKPVVFMQRHHLTDAPAHGIRNPRLPLETGIDGKETVIHRLIVLIEQDFNRAESLIDGLEQGSVFFFRFAQLLVNDPLLLQQVPHLILAASRSQGHFH